MFVEVFSCLYVLIFTELGLAFGDLQICDRKFSELIPCLDRNLIYQLKLKPNLAVMEHYERHCPPPERRYNCLIPPPVGYKVGSSYCLPETLL